MRLLPLCPHAVAAPRAAPLRCSPARPARAFAQPVQQFSPQGTVKGVRQATRALRGADGAVRRSARGRSVRRRLPGPGRGRWADPRNWVYDFDRDLPAGVRCSFTLKPGLTAADGTALDGGARFDVRHRRPGDRAQPALRGQPHRREPGVHPRPRRAGRRRRRSPPTRTASPPASTSASRCGWSPARSAARSSTPASRSPRATCAWCCSTPSTGRSRALRLRAAGDRQRRGPLPPPARRARFAAGHPRLRADAALRRRGEPGLGQGHRDRHRHRHRRRSAARVRGAAGVSRLVHLRARQPQRALPVDPAADARVHRAGAATAGAATIRLVDAAGKSYAPKLPKGDAGDARRRGELRSGPAGEAGLPAGDAGRPAATTPAAPLTNAATFPLKVADRRAAAARQVPRRFRHPRKRAARRREAAAAGHRAQSRADDRRARSATLGRRPAAACRRRAARHRADPRRDRARAAGRRDADRRLAAARRRRRAASSASTTRRRSSG